MSDATQKRLEYNDLNYFTVRHCTDTDIKFTLYVKSEHMSAVHKGDFLQLRQPDEEKSPHLERWINEMHDEVMSRIVVRRSRNLVRGAHVGAAYVMLSAPIMPEGCDPDVFHIAANLFIGKRDSYVQVADGSTFSTTMLTPTMDGPDCAIYTGGWLQILLIQDQKSQSASIRAVHPNYTHRKYTPKAISKVDFQSIYAASRYAD